MVAALRAAPHDWTAARLGDLGSWLSGGTPSMVKPDYWDGDIPWVSPKDMKRSRLWDAIDHVSAKALGNGTRLAPAHALLLVVRGMILAHTFPVARAEISLAFNQDIKALVPRDDVDSEYLLWWLTAHEAVLLGITSESTHGTKRMPTDALHGVQLNLPPLAEQRAIARALSDVDALLGALDRLIAKKCDLKQAAMQQLLNGVTRLPGFHGEWEARRLRDHMVLLRNGVHSRAELRPEGRVKYIHYGDVHASKGVFMSPSALPCLPDAKAASLERLRDGDLILADASEDVAGVSKSVELRGVGGTEVVSGLHTIAARFDKTVLADGYKGYLQFCVSFAMHLRRLASGTKVYATNRAHVASVEMRLPTVAEQTAIAAVLIDMDAELSALEARRDKTRALKQGMMQELLTGKTRLAPVGGADA